MPKHILVLGDPILDTYLHVEPSGIAQEAPIAKYRMVAPYRSDYPGGASNVANQIRTLLTNTDWTVREYPGGGVFGENASRKTRGVAGGTEVFRFDSDLVTPEITQEELNRLSVGADAIVVSDYEKGAVGDLLSFPQIPLFVDCKDPTKFPINNAIYFPNVKEYYANKGFGYRQSLMTRGSEGATLFTQAGTVEANFESPLPSLRPTSVIGAGDVVVATFTVASLLGFSPIDCSRIAVAAASLAVTKPYTPNVTLDDLMGAFLSFPAQTGDLVLEFCDRLGGAHARI